MKFIKWFFSEIRWGYLTAIAITLYGFYCVSQSIDYFIAEPWTILLYILTQGGFIVGMTIHMLRAYKES